MSINLTAQAIKVIVIIDKSGSMGVVQESMKPTLDDIKPLLQYAKENGGEVAFSIIGDNSKEHLKKYRHNGQQVTKPIKKAGMTQREYQIELIAYAKAKKKLGNSGSINKFIESPEMQEIFSHHYSGGSDVDGAIELAHIYLSENDPAFAGAERYAIIVSDGLGNVQLYKAPDKFCCKMIVPYLSSNIGGLQKYNPEIVTSLRVAVQSIIN